MKENELCELIGYYREQGAPQDQQMIIALLREAQEAVGGVLSQDAIDTIAQEYAMKSSMLHAIIRRVPGLRCETAKHRLEVCGTCRAGAKLREEIERIYGVRSGAVSVQAGFVYRVTPCMKNCRNGPSIRWDGKLYGGADAALVRELICGRE